MTNPTNDKTACKPSCTCTHCNCGSDCRCSR